MIIPFTKKSEDKKESLIGKVTKSIGDFSNFIKSRMPEQSSVSREDRNIIPTEYPGDFLKRRISDITPEQQQRGKADKEEEPERKWYDPTRPERHKTIDIIKNIYEGGKAIGKTGALYTTDEDFREKTHEEFQSGVLSTASAFERATGEVLEDIGNLYEDKGKDMIKEGIEASYPTASRVIPTEKIADKIHKGVSYALKQSGATKIDDRLKELSKEDKGLARVMNELEGFNIDQERPFSEKIKDPEFIAQGLAQNTPNFLASFGVAVPAAVVGAPTIVIGGSAFLSSALLEGGFAYNQADDFGATDQEAENAMYLTGVGAGLLETLPITKLLTRSPVGDQIKQKMVRKIFTGILNQGSRAGKQTGLEAGTESLQEIVANTVAMTYNEDQGLFEGAAEAGYFGALMGGGSSVVMDTFTKMKGGPVGLGITDVTRQGEQGEAKPPKKPQPETPDQLQEAKKYKTPEEFVKANESQKIQFAKTGNPITVKLYHGSPDARFAEEFDPNKKGYYPELPEALPDNTEFIAIGGKIRSGFAPKSRTGNIGVSFTDDYTTAKSYANKPAFDYQNSVPMVLERYVTFKNPKVYDLGGKEWNLIMEEEMRKALDEGHDGLIFKNIRDDYHPSTRNKPTNNAIALNLDQIKTKSQLTDIWNKANLKDTTDPKNFNTAEEFVKAQGTPVYHGTSLENANKINTKGFKVGAGKGVSGQASDDFIYATGNKSGANRYVSDRLGIKNPTVVEGRFNGKVLEIQGKMADFEAFGEASKKLGVPLEIGSQGKPTMLNMPAIKKAMQEQGYGAIGFSDRYANGTKAFAILPDNIKTKSQPTDIWDQVQRDVAPRTEDLTKREIIDINRINEGQSNFYKKIQDAERTGDSTSLRQTIGGDLYSSPIKLKFKKEGYIKFPGEEVKSPADIAFAFRELQNNTVESFYVLAMKGNKPVGVELQSMGTIDSSLVDPWEISPLLKLRGADNFYIIHNHPSGKVEPSEADIMVTERIKGLADDLKIKLKGHIIIDTTKFGLIDETGKTSILATLSGSKIEPKLKVSKFKKYQEWIGAAREEPIISNSKDLADLMQGLSANWDKNTAIILADSRNVVNSIHVLPKNKVTERTIADLTEQNRAKTVFLVNDKFGLEDGYKQLQENLSEKYNIHLIDSIVPSGTKNQFISKKTSGISDMVRDMERPKPPTPTQRELIDQAEGEVWMELDTAEAGRRLMIDEGTQMEEAQFAGIPSSFPEWIPSELRRKPLVESVKKHIGEGTVPTKGRVKKLYDIVKQEIYERAGVPVEDIKPTITTEEKTPTAKPKTISEATIETRKRRSLVNDIKIQFGLNDNDIRKVSQRDVRLMEEKEFNAFLENLQWKAVDMAETKQAKYELLDTIHSKQLKNVNNLRKAMELPPISKMSQKQLKQFDEALTPFHKGDIFLSQRNLELIDRTNLKGLKTLREAREYLAKEMGAPIEKIEQIEYNWKDMLRYDTALAEKNPFYKIMVERSQESVLKGDMRFLKVETNIDKLAKASEKSRKSLGVREKIWNKFAPRDENIVRYLEAKPKDKTKMSEILTDKQLKYANYIERYLSDAYDQLVKMKNLMGSRFEDAYYPHMRKNFLENVRDNGVIKAFRNLKKAEEQDRVVFSIIGEDSGEILSKEKFFSNVLYRSGELEPSLNVTKTLKRYVKAFEKKKALDEIIPEIEIYAQSLTPTNLTSKGLEIDRRLKSFVKKYINNKKGRKTTFGGLVEQNGTVDMGLRAGNTFVAIKDLGLNIFAGTAATIGEQVMTYQALGKKKYVLAIKRRMWDTGTKRLSHKNANKILIENKEFIGKDIWTELAEAGEGLTEKFTKGLFGFFAQSSVEANKLFLLGSISKAELEAGKLSAKRLSTLKLEAGRWRDMGRDVKSILGSTSIGTTFTKYKGWAIPILRTTYDDLIKLGTKLKNKKFKEAATGREIAELYRAIELTAVLLVIGSYIIGEEDDDSFTGKLKARAYREAMTFLGGVDPTLFISTPRLYSFTQDLAGNLKKIAQLERYKQDSVWGEEGDLKGVRGLLRTLSPNVTKGLLRRDTSGVNIPEIDIPEIDIPEIKIPEINIPEINI